ncbi:MAG TPA: hypothetical protein VD794_03845 [Flavisolibacter sp.]|nr:hypothetical protein [Flavisolibacter sp.]
MQDLPAQNNNTGVAQHQTSDALAKFMANCQGFIKKLNQEPPLDSIDKTPDGKAFTILISHIEMTLDEYFFGLWQTENFKWSVVANEIVGSIDLLVFHTVSQTWLKRTGAASIQIMVNAGTNALDVNNKKANALDMGFPKLKAECLKNAAQSLGKIYGRDLNRKKADNFNGLLKQDKAAAATNATEELLKEKGGQQ